MSIWKIHEVTLSDLQRNSKNTIVEHLGIEFIAVGEDYVQAKMPVDKRTHQPMGLLHGGAHVVLAETLGSVAANLCLETTKEYALGLDINSNHLKAISSGYVIGTAKPIHLGSKTQVWEIKIENEKGQLLNISRLTMMVLKHAN
ncbi:MAG: hotdog fold thioesterase [Chitinophagales bacterium]